MPQSLAGPEADLTPGEDLFSIVGVPPSASDADIRAAYRRRARIIHPDVNPSADASRDFRRLSVAAAILLSPRREQWGSEGMAEWPVEMEWRPDGDSKDLATAAKKWGPVWSAVIGPWLSWYAFVALDQFGI